MTVTQSVAAPIPAARSGRRLAIGVARGSTWVIAGQLAVLATSLLATPFVLRGLGPDFYGILAIVNVLIGYLGVSDLGLGEAATQFAARKYAASDRTGEAAVIWTGLAIVGVATAAAVVAASIGARWALEEALRVPPALQATALVALQIAAFGCIGRNLASVLNTPHVARLRMDLWSLVSSGCAIVQIVMVPVVIAMGGGLVAAVAVIASAALLTAALHGVVALRMLPELRTPRFDRAMAPGMIRFGSRIAISTVCYTILVHAEKVVLVRYSSPATLAFYAIAFNLASLLNVVPAALKVVLFPALSSLQDDKSPGALLGLYRRAIVGVAVCLAPIAGVMALGGTWFLRVWAGPEYAARSIVPFYILLGGWTIIGLAQPAVALLKALGRPGAVARSHVIEILPYLIAAVVLVWQFGIVGAALAWAGRAALDLALMWRAARRAVGVRSPFEGVAGPLAGAILLLGVPVTILIVYPFGPVTTTIAAAAVLAIYAAAVWFRVLDARDRRSFVEAFAGLAPAAWRREDTLDCA